MTAVSVIIPTLNAGRCIESLCRSLASQSIPNQVIVIDSSSEDETAEVARACGAKITTIPQEEFNHGATRNLGASLASGGILVFLTQDALPCDDHCIETLVKPLADPGVGGTYGRQVPLDNAIPTERFARLFNYSPSPLTKEKSRIPELGIKTFFFSNVCSAVRKSTFETLGRFPEDVIMDEDLYFGARLILEGYKIGYVPEARVFHSHNFTWKQQFSRYFDIGVFFRDNARLFTHTGVGGEGSRFVLEELKYLWHGKARTWIPYAIGETFAKFAGYKLGLSYTSLPRGLVKKMSLHTPYWDRAPAGGEAKGKRFKVQG